MDERRPIPGWEGRYEITRDGQVYSLHSARFVAWTKTWRGLPHIEVSIDGKKQRKSIHQAVLEAWGDASGLTAKWRLFFDVGTLELFQHVYATFRPPAPYDRKLRPELAAAVGKRGLFQVGRRIVKEDGFPLNRGEWAMSPRDRAFGFEVCPLSYLVEIEPAPPGAGKYEPGAMKSQDSR